MKITMKTVCWAVTRGKYRSEAGTKPWVWCGYVGPGAQRSAEREADSEDGDGFKTVQRWTVERYLRENNGSRMGLVYPSSATFDV